MQETRVLSPGQEDPLEEEMATHSGILAWEIPWTEEPGGLQPMRLQELDMTQQLNHCCVFNRLKKNDISDIADLKLSILKQMNIIGYQKSNEYCILKDKEERREE